MSLKIISSAILASAMSCSILVSCGQVESNIESEFESFEVPVSGTDSQGPVFKVAPVDPIEEIFLREVEKDRDTEGEASTNLSGPGVLKPTVYYFPVINEDKASCSSETYLFGAGGKKLLKVCPKTSEACALQGSCAVVKDGKVHTFNILGRFDGQDRYFEIEEDGCKYGYGVSSSCLDPFYTLAADLSIYKPGEVIFIPAVVGLPLPDGSKHSGYFVIRDRGRGIKGRGRFDFYTGYYSWMDPKNPFNKLGLGDVKTNIPYYRVKGDIAKQVLQHRAYPELPKSSFAGPMK